MFLIAASALLLTCPRCGSMIDEVSKKDLGETDRVCSCGYSEPASSPRALTFIESALDEHLRTIKIDKFRCQDRTFETTLGVSATGCLPLFTARASELISVGNKGPLNSIFPIVNIADNEAFLKTRCVATSDQIDISLSLLMLIEVVRETIDLSPSLSRGHYRNELSIDNLYETYSQSHTGNPLEVSVKRTLNLGNTAENAP